MYDNGRFLLTRDSRAVRSTAVVSTDEENIPPNERVTQPAKVSTVQLSTKHGFFCSDENKLLWFLARACAVEETTGGGLLSVHPLHTRGIFHYNFRPPRYLIQPPGRRRGRTRRYSCTRHACSGYTATALGW